MEAIHVDKFIDYGIIEKRISSTMKNPYLINVKKILILNKIKIYLETSILILFL